MKRTLTLIVIITCYTLSSAQSNSLAVSEIKKSELNSPLLQIHQDLESSTFDPSIPGYKKMKKGQTMTILDSIMFVGGVALMSTADALTIIKHIPQQVTLQKAIRKGVLGFY